VLNSPAALHHARRMPAACRGQSVINRPTPTLRLGGPRPRLNCIQPSAAGGNSARWVCSGMFRDPALRARHLRTGQAETPAAHVCMRNDPIWSKILPCTYEARRAVQRRHRGLPPRCAFSTASRQNMHGAHFHTGLTRIFIYPLSLSNRGCCSPNFHLPRSTCGCWPALSAPGET